MCSFPSYDLRLLKSHTYNHFKKRHNGIVCLHPNCRTSNITFFSSNALRIHMSRTHRTSSSTLIVNNKSNNDSNIHFTDKSEIRAPCMENEIHSENVLKNEIEVDLHSASSVDEKILLIFI